MIASIKFHPVHVPIAFTAGGARKWATVARKALAAALLTTGVLGMPSPAPAAAAEVQSSGGKTAVETGGGGESLFNAWWNGRRFTGDWLGARSAIEEHGLTLGGSWRGIFYGILESETGSRGVFTQELVFSGKLDFAKLTKLETLRGLEAFAEARWREPGYNANPNNFVEGSSFFNPSRLAGGVGWRLGTFGLSYTTPELFGAKDFLTVTGGWLRPQREFIDNQFGNLFANNAMAPSEGIGANIPFGASYSTWGGTLRVKPVEWYYAKAGLFMSYPESNLSSNNGLMFQGYAPDPSANGLFFMGETGVTPKIGSSKLPGRYVFGTYYYGEGSARFGSDRYGFYWQADQMLFREPSSSPDKLSDQGLHFFSLFTFAPDGWVNNYPFYFQSGLVYEGLIPSRDRDQLMFGLGFGEYSERSAQSARRRGQPVPTDTTFLEAGYRIKVNGWSFIQPFAQYIVQPNGTTAVANAAILGLFVGIDF